MGQRAWNKHAFKRLFAMIVFIFLFVKFFYLEQVLCNPISIKQVERFYGAFFKAF